MNNGRGAVVGPTRAEGAPDADPVRDRDSPTVTPKLDSVRDVRNLRVCEYCKQPGSKPHMVEGAIERWYHGRCFVTVYGEKTLLERPAHKTSGLTLDDIGPDLMRRLLDVRAYMGAAKGPYNTDRYHGMNATQLQSEIYRLDTLNRELLAERDKYFESGVAYAGDLSRLRDARERAEALNADLLAALRETLAWAQANLPARSDLHKSFPFFSVDAAIAKVEGQS